MKSRISSSALEIATALRSGSLTSVELVDSQIALIERENSSLKALCHVSAKTARKEAAVRDARPTPARLLDGVTCSIKDSLDVAGMPRGDGSLNTPWTVVSTDCELVAKLRHQGAIVLGKGNMAEYGKSYFSENPRFGATCNPWDRTRSPGGSGGGDAAAIASGMVSFALGVDSGGSIRVPANFCGLFGLLPTQGTLSSHGMTSSPHATSALLRNAGPLASSLRDIEVLFEILSGFDPRDPFSLPFPATLPTTRGKVLIFSTLRGAKADSRIHVALHDTARLLESKGYIVDERTPPQFESTFEPFIILAGQAALLLEDMLAPEKYGLARDESKEGPRMQRLRERIKSGLPPLTPEAVMRAWHATHSLRFSVAELFASYDFVLCPVAATLPPVLDASSYEIDGQQLQSEQVFQFASAVNLLGLPALAFPTGLSPEGLPIGLQLVGPRFSERGMIRLLREIGIEKGPVPIPASFE